MKKPPKLAEYRRMTRWLLLVAAVALACRRDDSPRESAMADSTLFGDDRARQGDSARTVPDVALLEHLVDEYEQLDVVMDELAGPTSGSSVKGKAWRGGRHEDADKGRLLDLLQAEFGERYHPRTPEGAARRTDGIAALPPDAGTRALNALVLDHHQRVYQAIGEALPRLRNPRVREQVTRLRQRLAEEIEQLKRGPLP
jgi:hypothetical protein